MGSGGNKMIGRDLSERMARALLAYSLGCKTATTVQRKKIIDRRADTYMAESTLKHALSSGESKDLRFFYNTHRVFASPEYLREKIQAYKN